MSDELQVKRPQPQGGDYRPHYRKDAADAYMAAAEARNREMEARVAELEAEIADDHDSVRAVAKECRDMDADQIRNMEAKLDQMTKERDEWKWMYEGLCK